ncbi:MAG TPA: hypothetical protein VK338_00575 [Candidatus Nitrosocosmicus sp.]|nr:hypothetical protein [Candidatus Nitrosocosmicus sp.]
MIKNAYAQDPNCRGVICDNFEPAKKFNDIGDLVNLIVSNLFIVAGIILFLGIVMGGFIMMTKGGDPEEMHKGQKMLTYSVMGILLIFVSYFAVRVLLQVLGIKSIL